MRAEPVAENVLIENGSRNLSGEKKHDSFAVLKD